MDSNGGGVFWLQVDQTVYTENCEQKCTCYETGQVDCEKVECPAQHTCLMKDGVRGCYRLEGVCSVTQGRKLVTFDDQPTEVTVPGMYVLASVCNESAATWFRALAQFSPCIEGGELGISALFIHFGGAFIAVTADGNGWVSTSVIDGWVLDIDSCNHLASA
eukprot:g18207.t1